MSASKEILAMMHGVAEGRVHPEEATESVARFVVEMTAAAEVPLAKQNDKYEKALREIVAIMADREKFVMLGIRAIAPVERIAKAALTGSAATSKDGP